jgi:hypothetical protein
MKTKYVLCAGLPLILAAFLLSSCAGFPSFSLGGSQAKPSGDFSYKIVGSEGAKTVTITGYTGAGGAAEIPAVIEEHPVTAVEKDAFDKLTTLTSLTIPASVALIAESVDKAEDAFDGATGLTSITVDEANSVYSSADGVLFNKAKTELILCPEGKSGSYAIPSSVTSIVKYAFEGCAKLTDITIPDSVTSIGELAFVRCAGLTSITIPGSVKTIGGDARDGKLYGAFQSCTGLKTVTLSEGITSIGWGAFRRCENLTSISIPNSVTYIGGAAFSRCGKLTSVSVSPVNGRQWDYSVPIVDPTGWDTGQKRFLIFFDCPLDEASKTALKNAGYSPRNQVPLVDVDVG